MPGLSVKLPLVQDESDGRYALNKTLQEMVKQDLRNLVMTIPGERPLIPEYGVGLQQYLFEPNVVVEATQAEIVSRIDDQVKRFMPYLQIEHVNFEYDEETNAHLIAAQIDYTITPLDAFDTLDVGNKLGNV